MIAAPAYLCLIEIAVVLMALQALVINRLVGIDYPFWSHHQNSTLPGS
jgi:hypothetical protein